MSVMCIAATQRSQLRHEQTSQSHAKAKQRRGKEHQLIKCSVKIELHQVISMSQEWSDAPPLLSLDRVLSSLMSIDELIRAEGARVGETDGINDGT